MAEIIEPSQLQEEKTEYDFMKFWREFTSNDKIWEENDGGSFMKWGVKRDLHGLCRVCYHYIHSRGNHTGKVTLRQIVDYVSKQDSLFAERVKPLYQDLPEITVRAWVDRVTRHDDKKLRKMLGLD